MNLFYNHSLQKLNTFGIDVKAKQLVEIFDEYELLEFLKKNNKECLFVLGSGSNVLFTDDFNGIVLRYLGNSIEKINENNKNVTLRVEAGVIWDDLVKYTVENNYYGLENLSLIPGTVGAAPIQNIGAYGVEVANYIEKVEGFMINEVIKKTLYKKECLFGYRDSIFKSKLKNKFIITSVTFCLSKEKELILNYRDLIEYFRSKNVNEVTAKEIRDAVISIRKSKLPDPSYLGNAGSFFKNPEITEELLQDIKKEFPDIPFHKINNKYKIPAAWLIEKCGYKGKRKGNVGTYEKQALIVVNFGGAKGKDIKNFADEIKNAVLKKFNVNLEYEVNIL